MYFPYLRGKQFELLALRELAELPLDSFKISPIIEPVKKDLKGIQTMVTALNRHKVDIQLIVNPEKGDLQNSSKEIINFISKLRSLNIENVTPVKMFTSCMQLLEDLDPIEVQRTFMRVIKSRINPETNGIILDDKLPDYLKFSCYQNNLSHSSYIGLIKTLNTQL